MVSVGAYAVFARGDVIAKMDLKVGDYFANKGLGAEWHVVLILKSLVDWAR